MPVLLITGASRGIGHACIVRALAQANVNVFAVARSQEALEELASQYSNRFAYLKADLTKKEACEQAVNNCIAEFGRLDAIVHSAGGLEPIAKAALPHLRQTKGAMVMLSSGAASNAYNGWGAYCTSKSALKMLTMVLAKEEPDVTTIDLLPGRADTSMQALIRAKGSEAMDSAAYDSFKQAKDEGTLVRPEDAAKSIIALALHARGSQWNGRAVNWRDNDVQQLI
ncbi:hypothetical protein BDF19DRAFT_422766 [Syncephalis fuscata]|nr:hypothetical protein BDF19DRAFT_422766 [Syncephalis fuscata]